MITSMLEHWKKHTSRERTIVSLGLIALILIGYYWFILSPLLNQKELYENKLISDRALYIKTVTQIRQISNLGYNFDKTMIINDIRKSMTQYNLSPVDFKLSSNNSFNIHFNSIEPQDFFSWQENLQHFSATVVEISIQKETNSKININTLKVKY